MRSRRTLSVSSAATATHSAPLKRLSFSRCLVSRSGKPASCALPSIVKSPQVGWMMASSLAISPDSLTPASKTATWCSRRKRQTESGTPIWELKDRGLAQTLNFRLRICASQSLTIVFPLEPVMASTGTLNCWRWWAVRACSRASGFSVRRRLACENSLCTCGRASKSAFTTKCRTPARRSSGMKSCPSARCPGSAKKRVSSGRVRRRESTTRSKFLYLA